MPGSAADVQSQYDARTKRELRVREGDRIVCVDGVPLDGNGIDAVITPAEKHVLLVERERKDELVTKPGTNALTKALPISRYISLYLPISPYIFVTVRYAH